MMADFERDCTQRALRAKISKEASLSAWAVGLGLMAIGYAMPVDMRVEKVAAYCAAAFTIYRSENEAENLAVESRVLEDDRDIREAARNQQLFKQLTAPPAAITEASYIDVPALAAPVVAHNAPAVIASKLKSTVVLGAPRAGKGYALAKALELLPANVDLWLIDPKNDPSESHYWARVPRSQRARFDVTELDQESVTEAVRDLFERYSAASSSAQKPKLLIVDECAPGLASGMSTKAYKLLMGKLSTICSVGPSKGKHVWIMSQAATVGDLGMSNANKASFRLVAVGHAQNTEPSWYRSLNASLGISKPPTGLTGYIQMIDNEWAPAAPFTLTAFSEPMSDRTVEFKQPRVRAQAATITASPVVRDRAVTAFELGTDFRHPTTKELYYWLKAQSAPKSDRDISNAAFAKRCGIRSVEAITQAIAPLLDKGFVGITESGYVVLK